VGRGMALYRIGALAQGEGFHAEKILNHLPNLGRPAMLNSAE
jgi:hypothetical protein